MSVIVKASYAEIEYDVVGAPEMEAHKGLLPVTIVPRTLTVTFVDDDLETAVVQGPVVVNGQRTKASKGKALFVEEDLDEAPEWVVDFVGNAIAARRHEMDMMPQE